MMVANRSRRQCKLCPWKVGGNPRKIPRGYDVDKHRCLVGTIAEPGALPTGTLRIFACHDSPNEAPLPCVGWLVQQLGPGNNLGLRLAVAMGRVDANVRTVGPQHERFEDTLPRDA